MDQESQFSLIKSNQKVTIFAMQVSLYTTSCFSSQAEYLSSLFPQSNVVKGFNVLSAYALESGGLQGSKQVD